jgi:hypothetical protein
MYNIAAREDKERIFLTAVAISLVAGTFPASAQGGGCEAWCRANRCSGGYMSGNAPKCMINCVAACQKKHAK